MENPAPKLVDDPIKISKDSVYEFVGWLEANNYSYNTISQYSKYINRLLKSDKKKTLISPTKIKKFLEKKTTVRYQSTIKKFIEFLEDRHDIRLGSFRYTRILKSVKEKDSLTRDEIKVLIAAMPDKEECYRFRLITELISNTGMRISEAISLRVENIDFISWTKDKKKNGRILIRDSKYNTDRPVYVSNKLMLKLVEQCKDLENPGYTKQKDSFVFDFGYAWIIKIYRRRQRRAKKDPTLFCYDEDVWDIKYIEKSIAYYRKIIRRVSLKVLKKPVHAHVLRHSYATYLDSIGVRPSIIQKILGHKNIATTSVYLHPSEGEMSQVVV